MMKNFDHILVVSRSTKHCLKALQTGISLAREYASRLYVLHVIHDPFNRDGWNLPAPTFQDEYDKMLEDARSDLKQMIKTEKAEGMDVVEYTRDGEPADEIQRVVESENIDLIIMLAHQEGRLEHFLFGRTNEKIIRRMPATLMLIKKDSQ
jgi:nucleotide-binding universal stress UspA family protein